MLPTDADDQGVETMDRECTSHASASDFEQALLDLPISEELFRASRKGRRPQFVGPDHAKNHSAVSQERHLYSHATLLCIQAEAQPEATDQSPGIF